MKVEGLEDAGAFGFEDVIGWALRGNGAAIEANDFGAKEKRFFDVMGDGEYGDGELRDALLNGGDEAVTGRAVDASEGLVEKQERGAGYGKGAGEVDALTFTAGETTGQSVGEWDKVEEGEGFSDELG